MATSDWFTKAFGAAVEDVRAKLIDEGWFGRSSPQSTPPAQPQDRTVYDDMRDSIYGNSQPASPFPAEQLPYPETPVDFFDLAPTRAPSDLPPEPEHGIDH